MVSSNQSVFVKKQCIHGNFTLVQSLIKELHRKKISAMFIKLDITEAFDSIYWEYLLDLMERLGFEPKWREWISIALDTSSSCNMLNGMPGRPIKHERGLRQVNPLSPMLFILTMDPLQKILHLTIERNPLHPDTPKSVGIKVTLYAYDTTLFVHPCSEDIISLKEILTAFGEAMGLHINLQKKKYSQSAAMSLIWSKSWFAFQSRQSLSHVDTWASHSTPGNRGK
jgi:hypothetical protein